MSALPNAATLENTLGSIRDLINISGALGDQAFDFEADVPVNAQLEAGARLDDIFLKIHIPSKSSLAESAPVKRDEKPLLGLGARFVVDVEGVASPLHFSCEGDVFPDLLQLSGTTDESWLLSVGTSNLTLAKAYAVLNISST